MHILQVSKSYFPANIHTQYLLLHLNIANLTFRILYGALNFTESILKITYSQCKLSYDTNNLFEIIIKITVFPPA